MCGGFRASRKFAVAKEDQIRNEMTRLAKLESGKKYQWPTDEGVKEYTFGGHARRESIESGVWNGKIKRETKIPAEYFSERDTKGGSGKFINFRMPEGKAMRAIVTNDDEIRIVTQQSYGNVKKYHHRMPCFSDYND